MQQKSIIIATPDVAQQYQLGRLLERLPEFRAIAKTVDLMNTYNEVEAQLPSAVLISDTLAALPEFEVMRALFTTLDVRWLVLSGPNSYRSVQGNIPISGSHGSDLFTLPHNATPSEVANQLYSLTRTARSGRGLGQVDTRTPNRFDVARSRRSEQLNEAKEVSNFGCSDSLNRRHSNPNPPSLAAQRVILIGSSTGGVDALLSVLSSFSKDCPPTLIVQHTGSGFGESLANLLDRQCQASVQLVKGPATLKRGQVLIGAGLRTHLVFKNAQSLEVSLEGTEPVSGHVPSVDALFSSALPLASKINAAILTGMGRDGADGLKALRNAGARTFAQDEATSVVYGMPRAAMENGGAEQSLPLSEIGKTLLSATRKTGTHSKVANR